VWIGAALFYGGLAQLLAGMWEFRNRNVFGATAFSTYGGFWMGLGLFIILGVVAKNWFVALGASNIDNALAWFLFAFAVFNFYMLIASLRVNTAVFGVFLTLQITEVLLVIGFFEGSHNAANATYNNWALHAGGWAGIVTAAVAWYTSAAGVMNGVSGKSVLPVGKPFVSEARVAATA
jgi:hypothetical protein